MIIMNKTDEFNTKNRVVLRGRLFEETTLGPLIYEILPCFRIRGNNGLEILEEERLNIVPLLDFERNDHVIVLPEGRWAINRVHSNTYK